jgi:hypothetical protein
MKRRFIDSISQRKIKTFEDIISDERIIKYLWIEFLLNPESVKESLSFINHLAVRKALEDAASWYLAFRWILPQNTELEQIIKIGLVKPFRIKYKEYQDKKRNFLKGLMYAGLC